MRKLSLVAILLIAASTFAQQIKGEYVETRSADIYTGQCFANGEMNLAGDQAIVAWEPLTSNSPRSEPAAHAQFEIASIFETEKGNPSEAIDRLCTGASLHSDGNRPVCDRIGQLADARDGLRAKDGIIPVTDARAVLVAKAGHAVALIAQVKKTSQRLRVLSLALERSVRLV